MNFPEFDKRYWLFIAAIFWVHLFAVISTYHRAITYGIDIEANPIIFLAFQNLGIIPTLLLTNAIGLIALIALPFIMKENAKPGMMSTATYTVFIGLVGLDSVHDFFVFVNNPLKETTMQFFNHYFGIAQYLPYMVVIAALCYLVVNKKKTNKEEMI